MCLCVCVDNCQRVQLEGGTGMSCEGLFQDYGSVRLLGYVTCVGRATNTRCDLHCRSTMYPFGLMERKTGEGGSAYDTNIKFC